MESEIEAVRRKLAALDAERQRLEVRLREFERPIGVADTGLTATPTDPVSRVPKPPVTNSSAAADKIALFRGLFGGRTDVFPVRWDNPKCGRSGYAPACANEWVRGICSKPQVNCGDCPNQKFLPVTPDVIECHLRGEDRVRQNGRGGPFVAGVYRLLFDDTCGFLAVDFDGDLDHADRLHRQADVAIPFIPHRTAA